MNIHFKPEKTATSMIHIEEGLLETFDFRKLKASRFAIAADENTGKLYGGALESSLKHQELPVEVLPYFPAGEESKTPEMAIFLRRELAKRGFDK